MPKLSEHLRVIGDANFPDWLTRVELETFFSIGTVNSWIVKGDTPFVVDTGMDIGGNRDRLLGAIEQQLGCLTNLTLILLTHAHPDHLGLTAKVASESGAEVFVSNAERDSFRSFGSMGSSTLQAHARAMVQLGPPPALAELLPTYRQAIGEFVLDTGDCSIRSELPDNTSILAFLTGGHTSGHTCFRYRNAVFVGDELLPFESSHHLLEPSEDGNGRRPGGTPSVAALELLSATVSDKTMTLPGHGPAFFDAPALARSKLRTMRSRVAALEQSLLNQESPLGSAFDIALRLWGPEAHELDQVQRVMGLADELDQLVQLRRLFRHERPDGVIEYDITALDGWQDLRDRRTNGPIRSSS